MFKITIIAVGKVKEKAWREMQDEYLKRLGPVARVQLIEVEAHAVTGSVSGAQSMKVEGERILSRIGKDDFVVALERTGKEMSSEELSEFIVNESDGGREITFIIGGAEGLDDAVLARANRKWSLSRLTFVHEMARIITLEQVYRAYCISTGKKYHK